MKKYLPLILLILACFAVSPALAQSATGLTLRLSRDFGYSSGTGQIQGTFSMKVSGPDNLTRVVFLIDGKQIGEATKAPFNLQFSTDSFALGVHTLSATGYTADGQELQSNAIQAEFVTAQQGWQAALKIGGPILLLALAITFLSAVIPMITGRGKKNNIPLGAQRNYGALGGAICPKCGRPFGIHLWGLNMLLGKLDRCPHCGKWSIVRRAPLQALRAAEEAELQDAKGGEEVPTMSEEEKLRKEIDDSRYQNF